MNIIKEIDKMRRDTDKIFRKHFQSYFKQINILTKNNEDLIQPLTDVEETSTKIKLNIDLPGLSKKDINVNIKDDIVEIQAEKKQEINRPKKGYNNREKNYSSYYRSIPLPTSVNTNLAQAKYNKGVLKVTIPKEKIIEKKTKVVNVK